MLCLLGPISVESHGSRTPLRVRPKALALLARLALEQAPVRRDALANLLFAEVGDPRASLRWHLNHLRSGVLDDLTVGLMSEGDAIRFTAPVDATIFALKAREVALDPGRADALEILSLYRGDLCAHMVVDASPAYDGWLYAEQERLRREFRLAVMAFGRRALELGTGSTAVEPLSRLVTVEPYLEEGHVLYIRLLEQASEDGAAHIAYRRYERILREELKAAPDPELAARHGPSPRAVSEVARRLPSERFVALPELTLHVVEWPGREPTILAIHGSGMSAYSAHRAR